ncbi:hypothetical protein HMF7854_13235 [Sphingomonas ginkgonis]|uniref:Uncharacterized protein n=1 Tax=Sphingomonas ginkgonis TaxID=2315330 RepID=A0A3R9YK47_9SPHN|nr:hypothetical protein [Sphingomonas ginkgonis]RST31692.1 hypothetical protein HMF7854_13235 [Sphingomonas ginkgonis]
MTSREEEARQTRRRWINIGELIALLALIVSALGLWNGWNGPSRSEPAPASAPTGPKSVPLALRGRVSDEGRTLTIAPADPSHALDQLTLTAAGKPPVTTGSDGQLAASDVEPLLAGGKREGAGSLPVTIAARYIEQGADRRGGGRYVIAYRWRGGGLFSGHSLQLTGFHRG